MTALYAILAIICIGGILMGAYLIGFGDGRSMKDDTPPIEIVIEMINEDEYNKRYERRHALTHADLVQLEQEAKNKQP